MLPAKRHAELMRLLHTSGPAAVAEIANRVGFSRATIRRDLAYLSDRGLVTRVHGGAMIPNDSPEQVPFATVATTDASDKAMVAQRAKDLVDDGSTVLIDIGTTAMGLARALRGRPVTVITSSLAVLDVLRDDPVVDLMLIGGLVRSEYHSLVGVLTSEALARVHADIAFLGASGVRRAGWVLDSTQAEVPVKKAMIQAADKTALVVDKHKFPGSGALRVCGVSQLDTIITNEGADVETLDACTSAGVEVITV